VSKGSYFVALEKAVPRHKNLMGKLYHAIFGVGRQMPDLRSLSHDELDAAVEALSDIPAWRFIERALPNSDTAFFGHLTKKEILHHKHALTRNEYPSISIVRSLELWEYLDSVFGDPAGLHCLEGIVAETPNKASGYTLFFENDTYAVAAALLLSDFIYLKGLS
jgi:hypothetical protein